MCKDSPVTSPCFSSADASTRKMSWADLVDDDDEDLDSEVKMVKSMSSTSTPTTTTSPKQSWADITDDDISEGDDPLPAAAPPSQMLQAVERDVTSTDSFADLPGVSVQVKGMPRALCTRMFLDAMLSQIDLEDHICGHQISEDGSGCIASLKFKTRQAAVKCHKHFQTCSWSTGTLEVILGAEAVAADCDPLNQHNAAEASPLCAGDAADKRAVSGRQVAPSPMFQSLGFQGSYRGWQSQSAKTDTVWQADSHDWAYRTSCAAQANQEGGAAWQVDQKSYASASFQSSTVPYFADAKTHEMMLARALEYAGRSGRVKVES